jgi:biopolymer transport protein ExbD
MAEKRRFLDVWIVDGNTVYREVPFTVVADWVQQGRLVEDDMLRPSGTKDWFRVGSNPTFAAYLPRSEPHRAEDKAEALEPVQTELTWRRRPEDDADEDVDMIPLIDVSLVLLIFFMMISSTGILFAKQVNLSTAQNGDVIDPRASIWISVEPGAQGPVYLLGDAARTFPLTDGSQQTNNRAVLLASLDKLLEGQTGKEIRIRADQNVLCDSVMDLIAELQTRRPKVGMIHKDVNPAR